MSARAAPVFRSAWSSGFDSLGVARCPGVLGSVPIREAPGRLFLGWSDYDDLSGYENFGWWDLQGDPENADQEEADAIDLDPDSDEADDFAEHLSRYE